MPEVQDTDKKKKKELSALDVKVRRMDMIVMVYRCLHIMEKNKEIAFPCANRLESLKVVNA